MCPWRQLRSICESIMLQLNATAECLHGLRLAVRDPESHQPRIQNNVYHSSTSIMSICLYASATSLHRYSVYEINNWNMRWNVERLTDALARWIMDQKSIHNTICDAARRLAARLTRARTMHKGDAPTWPCYAILHLFTAACTKRPISSRACFFALSVMPTSASSARGDVCSGSNSRTCPSEVEIATTARAEDEEGRFDSELEGMREDVAGLSASGSGTRAAVRECMRLWF